MIRHWRITAVLCILAVAVGAGATSYLHGKVVPRLIIPSPSFSSSSLSLRFSARSSAPVCGNGLCETTESQYCPRDCPTVSSSSRASSAASFYNPLHLSCWPLPTGNDGCSACLRALCPVFPEGQAISACQITCDLIHGNSSSSSSARSSASSQMSSTQGEPGGSYMEVKTSNAQMFQTSGEGWMSYGISRMHKNTIAANGAQPTATWQTQLPFGDYALYMYWPHDAEASEQFLMDRVPLSLNLNGFSYPITLNQRNPPVAFTETIGGAGPETVDHHWYALGTFKAVAVGGYEQPQTMRLFLSTGRASDSVKKAADGWVAAGDLRIYYKTPGIECGDGKCHESERETCPVDCEDVPMCGNGYCDVHAGETLQTCVTDCGRSGVCGNLRCETYNNENIASCPTDCQTNGTIGGDGGNTGGTGESSAISVESSAASSTTSYLFCGDSKCSAEMGETQETCPQDCGTRSSTKSATSSFTTSRASSMGSITTCGNARCDNGEDYISCPKDCANRCGDGVCNPTPGINPGENATNCPADCSYCGDLYCANHESWESCPKDCTRSSSSSVTSSSRASSQASQVCSLVDKYGRTCTDSDCGVQIGVSGVVNLSNPPQNSNVIGGSYADYCVDSTHVAEYNCMYAPGAVTIRQPDGGTYTQYVGLTTVYCPGGCAQGKCIASPSAAAIDSLEEEDAARMPDIEEEIDDAVEPIIDDLFIEPTYEEQVAPSCQNTDTAGLLCRMCLNSFCPFGAARAGWLCSLYCGSADLSAMLSANILEHPSEDGRDAGQEAEAGNMHIPFWMIILLWLSRI
jgi:hypothetical protein